MKTSREILDQLGRDRCAAALGVSKARIERATREDILPAQWFDTLERLAGEPMPRHLFTFKGAA